MTAVNEVARALVEKEHALAVLVAKTVCGDLGIEPPGIRWYASESVGRTLGQAHSSTREIWLYAHQDLDELVDTIAHEVIHIAMSDALKSAAEFERITENIAGVFGFLFGKYKPLGDDKL